MRESSIDKISKVTHSPMNRSKDPLILTHKCPSQEVFWSLLLTARAYVSVHFSWNEEEQVFEWVKLNRRKKWLKQKELLKRRLEKDNNFSDEDIQIKLLQDELEHIDLLAEDRIRIQGTSIAASQSMIFRFLAVGSLQRRIRQRVEVLCRSDKSDAQPSCAELFTLRSCMMNVLALLEEELEQWSRSFALHKQNEPALFRAWSELQVTENILTRLAQVFSCVSTLSLSFSKHSNLFLHRICQMHCHFHRSSLPARTRQRKDLRLSVLAASYLCSILIYKHVQWMVLRLFIKVFSAIFLVQYRGIGESKLPSGSDGLRI